MRTPIPYEDFAIRIEPDGSGAYEARVLPSSGDSAAIRFELPFSRKQLTEMLASIEMVVRGIGPEPFALGEEAGDGEAASRNLRRRRTACRAPVPEEIGSALFQSLFSGGVRDAYLQACGRMAATKERGLRLRLVLDPGLEGMEPVCALPWELLCDRGQFLSHNHKTPVVRYLRRSQAGDPHLTPAERPLRILVMISQPSGSRPLQLDLERRRIEEAWAGRGQIRIAFVEPPTLGELRRQLRDEQPHVLHFMGHGTFENAAGEDEGEGEGALLLEGPAGDEDQVGGRDLAVALRGCDQLRLAVLNACHSGLLPRRAGLDPFSGVASALVREGLPAVVAMQFAISDPAAITWSSAFYTALAAGDPVDAAVTEGRQAIHHQHRSYEWATPVLYLRVEHGEIFHFPREEPSEIADQILSSDTLIRDVTTGFVGRQFVFAAIEEFIAENAGGYFLIEGDPGIGKTALMAELVRRHGYVHHFNVLREDHRNRAQHFLANVCAQLIVRYRLPHAAIPPEATRGPAFLIQLLEEVSATLPQGEKAVILVDALDEVVVEKEAPDANLLHLPVRLPEGIFFVLTSRRLRDRDSLLRIACELKRWPLRHDSVENLADVRTYIEGRRQRPGIRDYVRRQGIDGRHFVDEMVRRSDGNFMYLRHVLPEIEEGAYTERRLEEIPIGLENYYQDHWVRMRELCGQDWFDYQLPVLAALTVAKKPISLELVRDFTGIGSLAQVLAVLLAWVGFLHTIPDPRKRVRRNRYRLYHETFHRFIREKDAVAAERVDLEGANRRIGEFLDREYQERSRAPSGSIRPDGDGT